MAIFSKGPLKEHGTYISAVFGVLWDVLQVPCFFPKWSMFTELMCNNEKTPAAGCWPQVL